MLNHVLKGEKTLISEIAILDQLKDLKIRKGYHKSLIRHCKNHQV